MEETDIDDLNLTLAEIFRRRPWLVRVFLDHQVHCPLCPIAHHHTVVDACAEYHLDEAAFRRELLELMRAGTDETRTHR